MGKPCGCGRRQKRDLPEVFDLDREEKPMTIIARIKMPYPVWHPSKTGMETGAAEMSDTIEISFEGRTDLEGVKQECLEAYPDAIGIGVQFETQE